MCGRASACLCGVCVGVGNLRMGLCDDGRLLIVDGVWM